MVECIQQYRMRYMVQAPADHPEYALDDVTMQTAKEFSQLDIGETIVSHRVISHDDALKLCDEDNDYTQEWTEEQKVKSFFTKENEGRGF
jgi:spermidine synthase